MNVTFLAVSDYSFVVVARTISFNIDTKRSVHLQLQSAISIISNNPIILIIESMTLTL